MVAIDHDKPALTGWRALGLAAALLFAQLLTIGFIFKHAIDFKCLDNWPVWACGGASGAMIAVYCAMGALAVTLLIRPEPFRKLLDGEHGSNVALGVNLAGALIALIPIALLSEGQGAAMVWPAWSIWAVALVMMVAGLTFFIAPLQRWRVFLAENWGIVLPVIAMGLATPYLATLIRPAWRQLDWVADATFTAVAFLIGVMNYDVETYPNEKIIGADDFYIGVAPVCSGIEGMALVTLFVTIYLALFRKDLRFPRALLLYPIGLAASAAFNVIRITVLLMIGFNGNPELAVGGFHSHAGWLMFTLVSIGIIALAQNVPGLQKSHVVEKRDATPLPPLRHDPIAAHILPFAVFMLSALFVSAFANQPALAYPLRALAMAGALVFFWPILRAIAWRLDPIAIGIGVAIGLMWILIPVEEAAPPYGELAGVLLIGWFVARGIGTIVLVPIIEELFFRDYLERKLRFGSGLLWKLVAATVIAGLFALLHDRWIEAMVASYAFSYVMARRDKIADAITAHAVANALVFLGAVATGNMAMI